MMRGESGASLLHMFGEPGMFTRSARSATGASLLHMCPEPGFIHPCYWGLTELSQSAGISSYQSRSAPKVAEPVLFGVPVRFELPAILDGLDEAEVLRRLGAGRGPHALERLALMIDTRAAELPLPDGCAVIPAEDHHRMPWPDALAALAILTRCSKHVWLRARHPSLMAALEVRKVSLLLPPAFAAALPESDA